MASKAMKIFKFLLVASQLSCVVALGACSEKSTRAMVTAAVPASAKPAMPSKAGKIAFSAGGLFHSEIYVMNADGTHQTQLTKSPLRTSSQPKFSRDGQKIVYVSVMDTAPTHNGVYYGPKGEIFVMNADGSGQKLLTFHPFENESPCFSPDGKKIAWTRGTGNGDHPEVWTMNTNGTHPTFVVPGRDPAFSPDGRKILFASGREGNWKLSLINADGTMPKALALDNSARFHPSFSPDGKKIVVEFGPTGNFLWDDTDICILNADGTAETDLTRTDASEIGRLRDRQESQNGPTRATFAPAQRNPCFSPDGTSLVFDGNVKDNDSDRLIRVMNLDGTGQIPIRGGIRGTEPAWAPGSVPAPNKTTAKPSKPTH